MTDNNIRINNIEDTQNTTTCRSVNYSNFLYFLLEIFQTSIKVKLPKIK